MTTSIAIYEIHHQVAPDYGLSKGANKLLQDVFEQFIDFIKGIECDDLDTFRDAVLTTFGDFAPHMDFCGQKGDGTFLLPAVRACFPLATPTVHMYLAGSVEFLIADLIELGFKRALRFRVKMIRRKHLIHGVKVFQKFV
jgi:hypothetical protein